MEEAERKKTVFLNIYTSSSETLKRIKITWRAS